MNENVCQWIDDLPIEKGVLKKTQLIGTMALKQELLMENIMKYLILQNLIF